MSSHNSVSHEGTAGHFSSLLKHWRNVRRLTQIELAGDANVSARHVCFLETGRAQPSREMVQLLGSALDLPLEERNALHVAAGFVHYPADDTIVSVYIEGKLQERAR
jgi:transcriptional regulator with XRE-family HTH domain